jgi:hypothetical protein
MKEVEHGWGPGCKVGVCWHNLPTDTAASKQSRLGGRRACGGSGGLDSQEWWLLQVVCMVVPCCEGRDMGGIRLLKEYKDTSAMQAAVALTSYCAWRQHA